MATRDTARQQALDALRREQRRPPSAQRQSENHSVTQRARALRDQLPSIAPDTTADYVREIREAADSLDSR